MPSETTGGDPRRGSKRRPTAREVKLDAIHDQLTKSVAALVTGNDWRRALEFAARFRSRSFNNTVLIYVHQNAAYQAGLVPEPMPTYAAEFKQWLSEPSGDKGTVRIRDPRSGHWPFRQLDPGEPRVVATAGPWRATQVGRNGLGAAGRATPGARLGQLPDRLRRDPGANRCRPCSKARHPTACGTGWPHKSRYADSRLSGFQTRLRSAARTGSAALSAGDHPQTHPAIAVVHVSILFNRHHGSRRISAPIRLHDVFRLHIWIHKAKSKRPSPNGRGPLTCDDIGSGGRI
jgi:hypothetical protein